MSTSPKKYNILSVRPFGRGLGSGLLNLNEKGQLISETASSQGMPRASVIQDLRTGAAGGAPCAKRRPVAPKRTADGIDMPNMIHWGGRCR